MGDTFSLVNKTSRSSIERDLPFQKIKEDVLGKKYELSVAFVNPREMKKAMVYKKPRRLHSKVGVPTKASGDKVSNVLSFPLSKNSGEIVICPAARGEFSVGYLFIHGLCHLKGHAHGATMERIERLYLKKWGLNAHE